MLWLRGPGSEPHDPPVNTNAVRGFAAAFAFFGAMWLVRAVAGVGGFLVVSAILLVVSLGFVARARLTRS